MESRVNNHNLLKYYQIPSHAVNCEIAATEITLPPLPYTKQKKNRV